jgi:hypothetical protein
VSRAAAACALFVAVLATGSARAAGPAKTGQGARATAAAPADTSRSPRAPRPAPPGMRRDAVRTLDAIHIEGEIAVPQVLFITARDFRRFRDGVGSLYQARSSDVARSVALPGRLRVVDEHGMHKEEGK